MGRRSGWPACGAALLALLLPLLRGGPRQAPPGRPCTALALPAGDARHFLLVRHGQTTFNAEKRFQGSLSEAPVLTPKGLEQARRLGAWLQGRAEAEGRYPLVAAVFASPLLRAQQTLAEARAAAAPGVLPPEGETRTLPELREIDLYEWQGRTQAEVRESDPEAFRLWKERAWELRLGGGRSVVVDLWERAALAWRRMLDAAPTTGGPGASSLVVAHGTLGKALLGAVAGLPPQAFRHFGLKNGEVVEIAWPQAATVPGGALWRRRFPEEGPWRSAAEEQAAFAAGTAGSGGGSVDAA